jgi:CRP-like cAMP-binding protein
MHTQNFLLAGLPAEDLHLLTAHSRVVRLLSAPLASSQHGWGSEVYFPHGGAVSSGIVLSDGRFIQSALIGRDGIVGSLAAPGPECGRFEIHVDTLASAIQVEDLREAAARSRSITSMLLRYEGFLLFQAQWIAACNACHTTEQRFASCLIRFGDVCNETPLPLTQGMIAQMLGLQRTSVCLVAHRMHQAGVIRIRRGHIEVLKRQALEDIGCECGRNIGLRYQNLVGAPSVVKSFNVPHHPRSCEVRSEAVIAT